jgi:hypothetical protein
MKKDAYCLSLRYNSVKKFANDCDKLISKFPNLYPGRKLEEGIVEKKKEKRQFRFQLSTTNNFNNHLPLSGPIVKIHKN